MSNALIRTSKLTKTYGSNGVATHALRGVDLEIARGSFNCIVGPSGHGKSTLMHLLGALDRPSSGSVQVDGTDLTRLDSAGLAAFRGRKIGFVFQFFNLLRGLSASENIETAMMLAGLPPRRQAERAKELLALVGLSEKAQARPNQLSGGQQQRVAIARALANDPEILMMDEPTGNLDSAAEEEILQILFELHGRGKTVVVVTHNLDIARRAQRLIRVQDGQIQA